VDFVLLQHPLDELLVHTCEGQRTVNGHATRLPLLEVYVGQAPAMQEGNKDAGKGRARVGAQVCVRGQGTGEHKHKSQEHTQSGVHANDAPCPYSGILRMMMTAPCVA